MKSYGIWLDLARLPHEQDCGFPFPCALAPNDDLTQKVQIYEAYSLRYPTAPRWMEIMCVCLRLNAGFIRFLLSVNLKEPLAPYISFKPISRSDLRAFYTFLSVPK